MCLAITPCWLGFQSSLRVPLRLKLPSIVRRNVLNRFSEDTRPFCKATRDLSASAETFVKYKEYIRRSDDEISKETLIDMLSAVKQYQTELTEDALDVQAAIDSSSDWQKEMFAFLSEVYDWTETSTQKTQELIDTDKPVGFTEYLNELIDLLTPRLRSFSAVVSILGNAAADAISTLLLILVFNFIFSDQLENLKFPAGNWGISWVLWTIPLATATGFVWNMELNENRKPLKGYRTAEKQLWFSNELFQTPLSYNSFLLLIKSGEKAWSTTVKYQGITLGILQSLWAGTAIDQDYAMTGFSMEGPVPSLLRLPVEILFLSSFSGLISLVRDKSLLLTTDQVMKNSLPGKIFQTDPRVLVKTLEEFELLNNTTVKFRKL
eukprot:g4167.t1